MKQENSKIVYSKLSNLYNNSFRGIVANHLINEYSAERILENPDIYATLNYEEAIVGQVDFGDYDMAFFSEDYMESQQEGLYPKSLRKEIESLAERVTQSIINSKE